ncbi:hypothetical protein BDV93DRAFT_363455 [Ceratobasidium sp. AG-I]|nr:hypothetical protein BDV93DRAFT_363455 [Ceratobasidium sp. AG-I]
MNPATYHSLEVPELIGLICEHTEDSDLASLLRVSQRLFYCVAPLVWRDVSRITELITLLPNNSGKLQLRLEPYDQTQLARFNIYTPFIQTFELWIDTHEGWPN